MIRLASLLFIASIALGAVADDGFAIVVDRSAGFKNPDRIEPMEQYRFTVAKDGGWKLELLKGEARKGTLDAEEVDQWVEDMEDAGLDTVASDPMLGALDEPFMEITVHTRDKTKKVRIRVSEDLAHAVQKMIVELAKPDQ